MSADPATIIKVPLSRGRIPKDLGTSNGSHCVPKKNSTGETFLKN